MTFVYVLIFVAGYSKYFAVLELKEYSTFEACKTAAEMAQTEQSSKSHPVAIGEYRCLAKPA